MDAQLRRALNAAVERLTAAQVPSPRLDAEILVMFTLACDRAYLYAHPERELLPAEEQQYDELLTRRSSGVPVQYLTGRQEFWGMELAVSPAVLIPRPETEHLVETVLEIVARAGAEPRRPQQTRQRIVDVGTGSGAIALALASELPAAEMHASDISPAALDVARSNAARHQRTAQVHFHQADLLAGFSSASFDIVVSNPPYVGEDEEESVQLEVRRFEPRSAVFAGPTGLEVIDRLILQAREVLRPGGWLVMEISGTVADRVRARLSGWQEVEIRNDLRGIARVAVARKPV
jgi:release factor glutamine methyltransferase